MNIYRLQEIEQARQALSASYHQFQNSGFMSTGLYVLKAGEPDTQSPHNEDEIYYVIAGAARFTGGDESHTVAMGDVIFVPAHEEHLFHDIVEDLILLVVFAPEHQPRQ